MFSLCAGAGSALPLTPPWVLCAVTSFYRGLLSTLGQPALFPKLVGNSSLLQFPSFRCQLWSVWRLAKSPLPSPTWPPTQHTPLPFIFSSSSFLPPNLFSTHLFATSPFSSVNRPCPTLPGPSVDMSSCPSQAVTQASSWEGRLEPLLVFPFYTGST